MDLNHIDLPSSLIAELYRSVLIDEIKVVDEKIVAEKKVTTTTPIEESSMKFLGENRKNILIMVDYEDAVHIPDEDLALLVAMLTACKLNIADVAIVNRRNLSNANGRDVVEKLAGRVVFLFGIDPLSFGLPLSFPEFQLQAFAGATYLFAPELNQYNDNPNLKRQLWESLKRLFVV